MAQNNDTAVRHPLHRLQQAALLVGVLMSIASLVGLWLDQAEFFRSYLLGYVMVSGVAVGCLPLLMLHYLASGPWGFMLRRFLEAGVWSLPLLALLFVPLLFGLRQIYVWADPALVAQDALLQHKQPYLNVPFFVGRTAVYLLIWAAMAWLLVRWSRRQDSSDSLDWRARAGKLSGPGLAIYLFTASYAAIDWMMTLEPHWYSTAYGLVVVTGQLLASLALALAAAVWLRDQPPLKELITPGLFHDMGNLLLGFLLLWMYVVFIQYLVIWSGNLPEEVPWFLHRTQGGWQWVLLSIVLLGFAAPFLALVSTGFQPRIRVLTAVTPLVFIMQLVNVYWLVMPAFYPDGWTWHWLHLAAPLALGSLWLAGAAFYLRRTPLLPQEDPRLKEIFAERERHQAA
ncbi:MAG: hypothetical protein IPM53_10660 [Anaerolineaceae bacterium]|nr:hypothetical protein [Anaerolineaceae bacterium]